MITLGGYHAQAPTWRNRTLSRDELVGLELEVDSPTGNEAMARDFNKHPSVKELVPEPIFERDGSLNGVTGVEVVGPPVPAVELFRDVGYYQTLLKALKETGAIAGGSNYGLHVNVNVRGWERNEIHSTMFMLNFLTELTAAVARRKENRWAKSGVIGRLQVSTQAVPEGKTVLPLELRTDPSTKYYPCRARYGDFGIYALEFRSPAGIIDMQHVRVCVEYVYAIREWCRSEEMSGNKKVWLVLSSFNNPAIMTGSVARMRALLSAQFVAFVQSRPPSALSEWLSVVYTRRTTTNISVEDAFRKGINRAFLENGERTLGANVNYDCKHFEEQAIRIGEIARSKLGYSHPLTGRFFQAEAVVPTD